MRIVNLGNRQAKLSVGEDDSEAGGNQSPVIFGMNLSPGPKLARSKLPTSVLTAMLFELDDFSRFDRIPI